MIISKSVLKSLFFFKYNRLMFGSSVKPFELKSVDDIMQLYKEEGGRDYGEDITMTEHAVQTALLARNEGYDEEVQAACLLHDIGHMLGTRLSYKQMDEYGTMEHEVVGEKVLRDMGFSKKVTDLVRFHVDAKRYLVSAEPEYYNRLSEVSKKTLEFQGGKMNEEEMRNFEKEEHFKEIIMLRKWEEHGKQKDLEMPTFESFKETIEKCLH